MEDFSDDLFDNYDFDVPSSQPTQTTQPQRLNTSEPEKTIEPEIKIKPLKLDEKLLLETNGLPLLKNESKHLKFMGKGYEGHDLKKLMTYYTVWANNLFPKYKFQDFARKVGKPASDKLVKGLVSTWQEEYREKLKVRRDLMNELSGKTVGDDEGIIRQDESSDDDEQRPLFIPFSSDTPRKEKTTTKKTQSKKPAASKKRNTYHSDDDESQPPQTITFSDDDDDDEENEGKSVKSGREYALAILAEKRKKRKLAQQKIQQQQEEEEEEEEEEEANAVEKMFSPLKPIDINMDEYYGEDIQLALSENELSSLNIIPPPTTQELENNEHEKADLDSEMHDI